jgi:hypothetical protein
LPNLNRGFSYSFRPQGEAHRTAEGGGMRYDCAYRWHYIRTSQWNCSSDQHSLLLLIVSVPRSRLKPSSARPSSPKQRLRATGTATGAGAAAASQTSPRATVDRLRVNTSLSVSERREKQAPGHFSAVPKITWHGARATKRARPHASRNQNGRCLDGRCRQSRASLRRCMNGGRLDSCERGLPHASHPACEHLHHVRQEVAEQTRA